MYFREIFFPEGSPKRMSRGWIVLVVIALLIGVAWHYGIITSVALALKPLVGSLWDMLSDMATAITDVLQYVFGQRNH